MGSVHWYGYLKTRNDEYPVYWLFWTDFKVANLHKIIKLEIDEFQGERWYRYRPQCFENKFLSKTGAAKVQSSPLPDAQAAHFSEDHLECNRFVMQNASQE